MPSVLKIKFTEDEEQKLIQLENELKTLERTRERIEALRFYAKGWKVSQIAEYLNPSQNTAKEKDF